MAVPKTDNELLVELEAIGRAQLEQQVVMVNTLDWLLVTSFAIIGILIIHMVFLGKGDH